MSQGAVTAKLSDLESSFRRRLAKVDLVGEIELSEEDRSYIADLLRDIVERGDGARACKWPATLSVFLVAQGVCEYRGGDYWSAVCSATGLASGKAHIWGRCFEDLLEDMGLWKGRELEEEGAFRYVGKILAHGGIPLYHQDEFFEFLLRTPSANVDDRAEELIEEWRYLQHSLNYLSRPVRRFLLYGRSVAQDFVERCLALLDLAKAGEDLDAIEMPLPERVLSQFKNWWKSRGQDVSGTSGLRWLRPKLLLFPSDCPEPVIDLPEQTLEPTQRVDSGLWMIAQDSQITWRKVGVYRRGAQCVTEQARVLIAPASRYKIALECGGVDNIWSVAGLDDQIGAMAFDPDTGRPILMERMRAGQIWLIVPTGTTVIVMNLAGIGSLDEQERLPLGGAWHNHDLLALDLSKAAKLSITRGGITLELAVVPGDSSRPCLVGGEIVPIVLSPSEAPVYSKMPSLCIPGLSIGDLPQLARYTMSITRDGSSELTACLTDLQDSLVWSSEDGCIVPLSLVAPNHGIGEFTVNVRGPMGRDARLRMRVIPGFRMIGHLRPRLESETPFAFKVECAEEFSCSGESLTSCHSFESPSRYVVTTPEPFGLIRVSEKDGSSVLLVIRPRIVTWSIEGFNRTTAQGSLRITAEEIRSTTMEICLYVTPNPTREGTLATLQLWRDGGLCQYDERLLAANGSGYTRFSLLKFLDTLRQRDAATHEFQLHLEDGQSRIDVAVLTCRPDSRFENVDCTAAPEGDQWHVEASWSQSKPIEDRVLRWWPLSRPWSGPYTQSLDPTVGTEWQGSLPATSLKHGPHLLEICVDDGWSSELAERPNASRPNVCRCDFPSLGQSDKGKGLVESPALDVLADLLIQEDANGIMNVCDLVQDEEASTYVSALMAVQELLRQSLGFVRMQQPMLQEIYYGLGRRPELLLVGLADCIADVGLRQKLVDLAIMSGALQHNLVRDAIAPSIAKHLWELWPPLGFVTDSIRLRQGEESAWRRAHVGIGILEQDDSDEITQPPIHRCLSPFLDSDWARKMLRAVNAEEAQLSAASEPEMRPFRESLPFLSGMITLLPREVSDTILFIAGPPSSLPWHCAALVAGCQRAAAMLGIDELAENRQLLWLGIRCYRKFPSTYALALASAEIVLIITRPWVQELPQ